jgi:hypothetical protein
VIDYPARGGSKIIEDVLFFRQHAGPVPVLAIFPAAP